MAGTVKIGGKIFPTPPQGKVQVETKQSGRSYVVQWVQSITSGGAFFFLTMNANSFQVPQQAKLTGFGGFVDVNPTAAGVEVGASRFHLSITTQSFMFQPVISGGGSPAVNPYFEVVGTTDYPFAWLDFTNHNLILPAAANITVNGDADHNFALNDIANFCITATFEFL